MLAELADVERRQGHLRREARFFGLAPFWESSFRGKGSDRNTFVATRSGHVLLHKYEPTISTTAVDVYRAGRFVRTAGPFPGLAKLEWNRETGSFSLATSPEPPLVIAPIDSLQIFFFVRGPVEVGAGATDTLVDSTSVWQTTQEEEWRERAETRPDSTRIRWFTPEGDLVVDEWVPLPDARAEPHPLATGVIIRNTEHQVRFWRGSRGERVSLDLQDPSASVACWFDDAVVFRERTKDGAKFSRVDLDDGRTRWRVPAATTAIADGDWLYVYDLEPDTERDREVQRHRILALDVATAETLFVWRSDPDARAPGNLVRSEGTIFFFTKEGFAPIDRARVREGRFGWRPFRPTSGD
ncbi:MAG: hypothetical protein KC591_06240 [Gemmatimonadetes bacterium]|nr:hypothetical protein [Gemmatimonadota bacterium]